MPGQTVQLAPQDAGDVLDTQAPPQTCVPATQSHWCVALMQVRFGCAAQSALVAQPAVQTPLPRSQ
jgi:hypothetical protein